MSGGAEENKTIKSKQKMPPASGYFRSLDTRSTGFTSGSLKIGASMFLSFVVVADNYSPVKQLDIGGTASSLLVS
ncbi:hypothetical protein HanRHA438_Chr16g0741931 [Helianthus annuus]|nr:hypothetical protein HanIR_Chr16g0793401 [Helianthus annuus]KAJ0834287.1 hypothetical protein HanRHA438_Chr16g0741931 [Helianthus annuus]